MPYAPHVLGQAGEDAAAAYLLAHDATLALLHRSYRHGRAEIDLIFRRADELLLFVEVKTRTGSGHFGAPETFVSTRKKELFHQAATHLQETLDWRGDIRFDIIALNQRQGGFWVEHFEDAF